MQLATIVDREGRASVRNGNIEYCIKAKDEIQVRKTFTCCLLLFVISIDYDLTHTM